MVCSSVEGSCPSSLRLEPLPDPSVVDIVAHTRCQASYQFLANVSRDPIDRHFELALLQPLPATCSTHDNEKQSRDDATTGDLTARN